MPEGRRRCHAFLVNGNACSVGDTVNGIEPCRDRSRIHHRGLSKRLRQCLSGIVQESNVVAQHSLGECHKKPAMGNTAIALDGTHDALQIYSLTSMLTARTEQHAMAGSSIDALVDGRHPARNQFYLLSVNSPCIAIEIIFLVFRQVVNRHEVHETMRILGHQA